MLKSFRNIDQDSALLLLSHAAQSLLPHGEETAYEDTQEQESLIAELRERLGIADYDQSRNAESRLLEAISSEISSRALSASQVQKVKERLGQRGELRSDLYQVEIHHSARRFLDRRGIRPSHLEAAMAAPDDVEHLSPERFHEHPISIYIKRQQGETQGGFTLLIVAVRRGYIQTVHNAFRIYHSDLRAPKGGAPTQLLRAFLDEFGVTMTIGPSAPSKLFLYEALPFLGTQVTNVFDIITFEGRPAKAENMGVDRIGPDEFRIVEAKTEGYDATILSRFVPGLAVVEIALAFAVQTGKYAESLKRHGVSVK